MATIETLALQQLVEKLTQHELARLPRMLVTGGGGERLRVGVFAITEDDELVLLVDAFPDGATLGEVAREVLPALMGRWDVDDGGRWNTAWTVGTPEWVLWSRVEGRSFWVEDGAVHRAGPKPALPIDRIAAVQTWASPGWYEQGVELRMEDDTTVVLAQTTSWSARLDPDYSFEDLTRDLGWAAHLGRDLATLLHVSVGEAIPPRDG